MALSQLQKRKHSVLSLAKIKTKFSKNFSFAVKFGIFGKSNSVILNRNWIRRNKSLYKNLVVQTPFNEFALCKTFWKSLKILATQINVVQGLAVSANIVMVFLSKTESSRSAILLYLPYNINICWKWLFCILSLKMPWRSW